MDDFEENKSNKEIKDKEVKEELVRLASLVGAQKKINFFLEVLIEKLEEKEDL